MNQCEKNGGTCGTTEPYDKEIMAGSILCLGCGRTRPNKLYRLVEPEPPQGKMIEDELPEANPHECPNCNWQCTCSNQPCSCCSSEPEPHQGGPSYSDIALHNNTISDPQK